MSRKRIPHPFKPGEHVEGAAVTKDTRSLLAAGIAEHVVGHRVTKVEFIRSLDKETSTQLGAPMDTIDLVLYLDNNVAYIARLVLSSFATVSRGEALSHILRDDEIYVSEHADNDDETLPFHKTLAMHINHTPDAPPRKPCMRDYSELLRDHLPAPLVKLIPMEELKRRGHEIVVEHPRFREEVPLALADEEYRRQRLSGQLQVTAYQTSSLQHHA